MSFFGRNTPSMTSVQSALSQTLQRARPLSRNVHITHIRPKPTTPSPMASTSRSATSSATSTLGSGLSSSAAGVAGPNGSGPVKKTSGHLVWYREIVPAMIPILLLSTTIFLSLTLLRTHLSHNLTLSESATKITELETQLARMRQQQRRARERERKERERILPIVVERVLQKVGAMSEELQEEEEAEPRLLV